jgi:hypothetical protein
MSLKELDAVEDADDIAATASSAKNFCFNTKTEVTSAELTKLLPVTIVLSRRRPTQSNAEGHRSAINLKPILTT